MIGEIFLKNQCVRCTNSIYRIRCFVQEDWKIYIFFDFLM